MTKRQFSLLVGLVGQAACVVYDDAPRRDSDAADGFRDGEMTPRDAIGAHRDGAMLDAVAVSDVEASRDANLEAGAADATTIEDAPDAVALPDGREAATDAVVGPPVDAPAEDVSIDARTDADAEIDVARDGDVRADLPDDPPIVGCTVDFTVSGVTWDEDGSSAGEGGARVVRLVGSAEALGAWAPEAGRAMTEKAPGAWSVSVALADKLAIEFKFVKMPSGRAAEWEQWLPFDSNRAFLVDCAAEGGTVWIDAATDAGPANRAAGRSYGGAFGVRPLDATK